MHKGICRQREKKKLVKQKLYDLTSNTYQWKCGKCTDTT